MKYSIRVNEVDTGNCTESSFEIKKNMILLKTKIQ